MFVKYNFCLMLTDFIWMSFMFFVCELTHGIQQGTQKTNYFYWTQLYVWVLNQVHGSYTLLYISTLNLNATLVYI